MLALVENWAHGWLCFIPLMFSVSLNLQIPVSGKYSCRSIQALNVVKFHPFSLDDAFVLVPKLGTQGSHEF